MAVPSGRTFRLESEFLGGSQFSIFDQKQKIGCENQKVKLRIDPFGLILYWDYAKSRQRKFLFVDAIVDVRIQKERENEMVVVCNRDFTSAAFFGFQGEKEVVERWSDYLLQWALWHKRQYRSVLRDMNRLFAPIMLEDNQKFRIENAYEHLSCSYKFVIGKFAMGSSLKSVSNSDEIQDAYLEKVPRPEINEIFNQLAKGKTTISVDDFMTFINYTQRDYRLNEEVYPYRNAKWTLRLIDELEPGQKELSYRGFAKFLLGDSTTDIDSTMQRLKVAEMMFPITHYYINSSHNTYLNGNQIHAAKALNKHEKCETEVEMYRQILLSGCRCVEVDCWDGSSGPIVTHGPVGLQQINTAPLEAIMDSAFKSSDYPVIISLENHCSPPIQQIMAEIFVKVFGKHLQNEPLDGFPLELGVLPPPPHSLRNKILLKGSKSKAMSSTNNLGSTFKRQMEKIIDEVDRITGTANQLRVDEYVNKRETVADSELNSSIPKDYFMKDVAVAAVETKAALGDLINYFQTTPHLNYDDPEYLMHSGSERKIDKIITKKSTEFIQHTARHVVRVYPDIRRVDSSNYIPMYFWTAGCQMVSLNWQTSGLPMQMNQSLFEENGHCGYVLKAPALRQKSYKVSVHDGHILVAHRLEIEVRSAQLVNLITQSRKDVYRTSVRVDLYDLPNDTIIDQYTTPEASSDGYNTLYPKSCFLFEKIIKPEHAMLHIRLMNELGVEIAQRFLPVHKMQSGYRHIIMRNRDNRYEGPTTVFVKIKLEVYVPAYQEELRQQYANPLKSLKEQEELRQQLANPMRLSEKRKREAEKSAES